MFSNFFIDRPIFAAVVSIFIFLAGLLALVTLPIAQYPKISPPTVSVNASYPGANADVVEKTIATPIEEQVNGAQDMLYMSSTSSNTGQMSLTVTFALNRSLDLAAVDVQNRLSLAQPQLPEQVVRQGITVRKQSTDIVLLVSLTSPGRVYDPLFLSNYATIHLVDSLARVPGVGNVTVFGQSNYGMRIWLDPDRLAQLGLTATDVQAAIAGQNVQAPAGQVGQPPVSPGRQFQYTVQVKGRLSAAEEFADIILRANPDGSFVRIRDIGRVELGADTYSSFSQLNGQSSIMIAIFQLPDANALDVVSGVEATVERLAKDFPPGIEYGFPLDRTRFVTASIREVLSTLVLVFVLVFAVVYVFLQNWRATLIPAVVVPVSLVGAAAFFPILQFSLNTMTFFGLVVDDAIVVVEAAQRHVDREGVTARDAAKRAMAEVSSPVVAIALVLTAVFVPVAFLGGVTGQLYKQFALTLAVSVLISAFEALTLSPAMCGLLLKPAGRSRGLTAWLFKPFNWVFTRTVRGYESSIGMLIRHKTLTVLAFVLIGAGVYRLFTVLPSGFVPAEDQGYFMISVQLPNAASLERTAAVMDSIQDILESTPGVESVVTIGGRSILSGANASNVGTVFVMLKPWSERTTFGTSVGGIIASAQRRFDRVPGAVVMSFNPPAIPGLGRTGGFEFELQNRGGSDIFELAKMADRVIEAAQKRPEISGAFTTFRPDVPQIRLDVDRARVISLGVPLTDVFLTLQTYLGGLYVNDFNQFGRTYRVWVEADSAHRSKPDDIGRFYVRSSKDNSMVPLSTVTSSTAITGPDVVDHYNIFQSVTINGSAAPGYSSGQAITAMEEVAASVLPPGYGYEWTGLSYQEVTTRGQATTMLLLAIAVVFLLLAALYESWSVPLAVILIMPVAIFGALLAVYFRGLDNNVYAQIGFVMVVGLAAKNAILIVEFAKVRYDGGTSLEGAAVEGALVRFRPILMTSFAFIFGVLPLVIASGAGSAAHHALGTSVLGGMIAATILGVFFVPVYFVLVELLPRRLSLRRKGSKNR